MDYAWIVQRPCIYQLMMKHVQIMRGPCQDYEGSFLDIHDA